jgi:hypothetical protein
VRNTGFLGRFPAIFVPHVRFAATRSRLPISFSATRCSHASRIRANQARSVSSVASVRDRKIAAAPNTLRARRCRRAVFPRAVGCRRFKGSDVGVRSSRTAGERPKEQRDYHVGAAAKRGLERLYTRRCVARRHAKNLSTLVPKVVTACGSTSGRRRANR